MSWTGPSISGTSEEIEEARGPQRRVCYNGLWDVEHRFDSAVDLEGDTHM